MYALTTPRVPLDAMTEAMLNQELSIEVHRILDSPQARDQVLSAALVATHLHAGQTRFATDSGPRRPYIEHPLRNTLRLIRWGVNNTPVLTGSLLHDTVEDHVVKIITNYTPHEVPVLAGREFTADQVTQMREHAYAWLELGFAERASTLVKRVTNPLDGAYIDHITDMVETARQARKTAPNSKEATIALQVLLIKAADLVDNAGPLVSQHRTGAMTPFDAGYLVERYTPAVSVVLEELHENRAYLPAARAFSELELILVDLEALQLNLKSVV